LRVFLRLDDTTDTLGAAIRNGDLVAVKASSDDAFALLADAIVVFHRLETEERDPERIGIAWSGVRTHYRAVTDLFERAKRQLADPDLYLQLEQLRISLALALQGLGEPSSVDGGPDPSKFDGPVEVGSVSDLLSRRAVVRGLKVERAAVPV
jgi:hypothetical protein